MESLVLILIATDIFVYKLKFYTEGNEMIRSEPEMEFAQKNNSTYMRTIP